MGELFLINRNEKREDIYKKEFREKCPNSPKEL
jgi:hypothetical protein